jgi:SAM-dependent methyltransferase
VAWDPDRRSAATARRRLAGTRARLIDSAEVRRSTFAADFVLSFSVLEHVYDRRDYLALARRHLARDGRFFLNYDDGHFRVALDLEEPRTWPGQLMSASRNLLGPLLARLGRVDRFQARVARADLDELVASTGLVCEEAYYSNLADFKLLAKHGAPDRRDEFVAFWLEVEEHLNARFAIAGPSRRGDTTNLWRCMRSRTLVLARRDAPEPQL